MWTWLQRLWGAEEPVPEPPGAPEAPAPSEPPVAPPVRSGMPEDLAVRADWLAQQGDPRGDLINAELMDHPQLDLWITRNLPVVLGPLLRSVVPLKVRYGAPASVGLREIPDAEARASTIWQELARIEATEGQRRAVDDPRVKITAGLPVVPRRFVPWRLVRAGFDRRAWLAWDLEREEAVLAVVPDPDQVIEPHPDGLEGERVIGAELFEPHLEPLGPQPWSDEDAQAVGATDPSQWYRIDGVLCPMGRPRPWNRPRCVGVGWAGLQSRGGFRQHAEDGFYGDGQRFVVMDGGTPWGEIVARAAIERGLDGFARNRGLMAGLRALHDALDATEMGASVVGVYRTGLTFQVVWCGDCRAYRIGPEGAESLTRDHSLLERMREEGRLGDDELENHPLREVVTRNIGMGEFEVEALEVVLQPGERLLLCSKGLWRTVLDERIADAVGTLPTPAAVERLVRWAAAEARSEVTAVLIEGEPTG